MTPGRGVAAVGAGPRVLPVATVVYLALLPLGHLGSLVVRGAWANWADLLLAVLLAAGALDLVLGGLSRRGTAPEGEDRRRGGLGPGPTAAAVALFLLFGGWVLASSFWSHHPGYAAAKGVGIGALALGVACIRWSGLEWRRAADAWLAGTAASLVVVCVAGLLGPEPLRSRVLYFGGMVHGLPFPRISGPFGHPNLFGDYLVLSGVLLWVRWPAWSVRWRKAALVLAGLLAVSLFLTTSTAWLAAGVLVLGQGLRRRRRTAPGGNGLSWLLVAVGAATAAATAAGMLFSMNLSLGPVEIATGGIRPRIWGSALGAFLESPILGVGGSPYLAEAAEPLDPGQVAYLWDAHSSYLSVMGQYGLVGTALLGAGLWVLVRAVLRIPSGGSGAAGPRLRPALLAGLLAMAVHSTAIAGEDFRHWWAWLGVSALGVGSVAGPGEPGTPGRPEPGAP